MEKTNYKENQKYTPLIKWLNKLPENKIFVFGDLLKIDKDYKESYLKSLISQLSTNEYYICKNKEGNKVKSYVKLRNIPIDKSLSDIVWDIKYRLETLPK